MPDPASPLGLDVPAPVVKTRTWRGAVVQGTFADLERTSVSAGTSAIRKKKSHSARVKALRAATVKKAKAYTYASGTYENVGDGIRVRVNRADKDGVLSFTLTVSGSRVRAVDNF